MTREQEKESQLIRDLYDDPEGHREIAQYHLKSALKLLAGTAVGQLAYAATETLEGRCGWAWSGKVREEVNKALGLLESGKETCGLSSNAADAKNSLELALSRIDNHVQAIAVYNDRSIEEVIAAANDAERDDLYSDEAMWIYDGDEGYTLVKDDREVGFVEWAIGRRSFRDVVRDMEEAERRHGVSGNPEIVNETGRTWFTQENPGVVVMFRIGGIDLEKGILSQVRDDGREALRDRFEEMRERTTGKLPQDYLCALSIRVSGDQSDWTREDRCALVGRVEQCAGLAEQPSTETIDLEIGHTTIVWSRLRQDGSVKALPCNFRLRAEALTQEFIAERAAKNAVVLPNDQIEILEQRHMGKSIAVVGKSVRYSGYSFEAMVEADVGDGNFRGGRVWDVELYCDDSKVFDHADYRFDSDLSLMDERGWEVLGDIDRLFPPLPEERKAAYEKMKMEADVLRGLYVEKLSEITPAGSDFDAIRHALDDLNSKENVEALLERSKAMRDDQRRSPPKERSVRGGSVRQRYDDDGGMER